MHTYVMKRMSIEPVKTQTCRAGKSPSQIARTFTRQTPWTNSAAYRRHHKANALLHICSVCSLMAVLLLFRVLRR